MLAYWGFGLYWGKAVSQNAKGHILGHVKVWHHPLQSTILATLLRDPAPAFAVRRNRHGACRHVEDWATLSAEAREI